MVLENRSIACSVVLWAAGVRANPLTTTLGAALDRSGRVKVEKDLSLPATHASSSSAMPPRFDGKDGQPLPGVSPVAMQQARTVAKSIRRALVGRDSVAFSYFDKGSMATIGRRRAIAMVDRMHLSGFLAWMAWLLVHIWYLIGFRNRLVGLDHLGMVVLHVPARSSAHHRLQPERSHRVARTPHRLAPLRRSNLVGSGQRLVGSGQSRRGARR